MGRLAGVVETVVSGAIDVARLVVPVACAGCGREDVRWCDECAELWWAQPWRADEGAGRLDVVGRVRMPVWTVQPLRGPAHAMIAQWKRERRDLDDFFRHAAARMAGSLAGPLSVAPPLAIVPVPSRPASRRRRGVDLPRLLASGVVEGLAARGVPALVEDCLEMSGRSSRTQGARGRWVGAARALSLAGPAPAYPVVLVDDVVTTGASLATAARLLEAAGAATVAGLTLAAAEPRASVIGLHDTVSK